MMKSVKLFFAIGLLLLANQIDSADVGKIMF